MIKKVFTLITAAIISFVAFLPSDAAWASPEKKNEPEIKAESAIIYIGDTGEIIWDKNSETKMEPASITKLMTCLLAAENLDLSKEVEITAEAVNVIPTKIYLQAGEKITVEQLMYAALLKSANDAANALAIEVAGSIENFAVMMNERAAAIGCNSTNFVNPNGLSAEGHISTAKDLAIIAKEALDNETVRKIASTTEYTIPKTNMYEERELYNFNMFLYGGEREVDGQTIAVEKYDGVFGGKTGSLSKDYCTMVTGLDCDGLEVYTVVMGTDMASRFNDMKTLMDYGKANISKYKAFEKGEIFGKVKLKGGSVNKVKAAAAEDGYVNLPEGASASLVTTECVYTDNLKAPIKKGQKIGVIEIYIAGDMYRTVDLIAASDVKTGWFLSKYGISNLQTVILGIVLFLILSFIITIFALRAYNKKKRLARRKAMLEAEARRHMEREEDLRKRNWNF
ncbi:MAG: D-alanyl-D-alanine carboxypeptidase family protein [Anaerovoracaceae bacterium]|nr:D-alanyl-D-alanine carboxypeptidase [Bacillota bacterium]MEE0517184.1 D-alanyl-D-alanine carboxypeptidase family protein [Anaerovoracaceae bacterium]